MKNNPQQSTQENKMGVMPIGPLLAGMAVPMMISMLVQALYNVVDSIFVARLSQDALNAVSLAFPLQNLMIAVGGGTGVGMNALLSRSLGEKDQDQADRAANTGIFIFFLSAIIFGVCGVLLARPFFLAQTDIASIVDYGTDYARICLGLSIGIFSQFCFERLLQSTGRTVFSMVTQLIGAVINIVMDPILIFGLFGFPRMEVAGAAAATVLGQIVAACIGLIINLRYNKDIHIRVKDIRPDRAIVREIYRVGVPSIVMQSIGSIMVFGMNKILMGFTDTATAVFGAYFKLQSFIFMPVFGLNNGMVPIISYNYGAARLDRVKRTFQLTAVTATVIMCLGCAAFNLIPETLLGFFSPSAEMLDIGTVALRVISYSFLLAGFDIIAGSVCQAIGNPIYTLICSVCRQLVALLPAAWLLARTGVLDLVWFCFPISEVVSLVLSIIFLRRTMRRVEAQIGTAD
ncbi:MATE family efflux transporter [Oscillibacter sp. 1-3]|uniref:MATE family efflux transporter n=1 Tax=Oscillibacter sp. 1-3 TaxID=1235797 RepID=UPI00033FF730|nr:MATE family efflux transporter [Oscillibacter sp. 1-3]EOS65401.1 MATE efflux family protein [Oscillibacter sp. 1-3]MCI9511409.1 MATE family efflux transporter [Oscillibacter sp.]